MGREIRVSNTNRQGCLLLFGLGWTAFSLIFVVIGIVDGVLFSILFGGFFVLIGLLITGYAALSYYTRFRIGKPDINISQTTLRLGDPFTMNYIHRFNSSIDVEDLLVQLIFRETATYQQGTDTRTVTHDHIINEYRQPGRSYQSGTMITDTYEFQIPPDGMHTLKVRRNRLEWFLSFKLTVPRLPDFLEEYELTVVPERVEQ